MPPSSDQSFDGGSVLTVGHSTLSYEAFLKLIRGAGVTAIADVRSAPYSRQHPHFNRETLRDELRMDGVAYVFLGEELGGRPRTKEFFCDDVADYERMAETPAFASGLERVSAGAKTYRVALMCSEQDPLDCHRCLMVGRALARRGVAVEHILPGGQLKSQAAIEDELLGKSKQNHADFFADPEQRLNAAYRSRSMKVAYSSVVAQNPRLPTAAE